uniref:RUN domain-containing protein n=1 Tax=Heterorhabditis bacteriophora TaxID=37862 RepID=A0A1I7XPI3_HETBA
MLLMRAHFLNRMRNYSSPQIQIVLIVIDPNHVEHASDWAHSSSSRHVLCDCSLDVPESEHDLIPRPSRSASRQSIRIRELSIVGLPIYSSKRSLVETVVEGVAALARGDGPSKLVAALRILVEDGLNPDVSIWKMIKIVTAPGPATKDVYSIVRNLDSCEKSDNSRADIFFEELCKENSLDCWLCYVVLKENVLRRLYSEGGFLLRAPTAYRSLLWRLVDSLALIPDSRVPKSSSVPARLFVIPNQKPSRIPLPKNRPPMSRTLSLTRSISSPLASVLSDMCEPGRLTVSRGESVRVLSRRGHFAQCYRVHRRRSHVSTGIIPLANLLIQ